jgi:hypothetical protein
MTTPTTLLLVLGAAALAGCAGQPITALERPSASAKAEVVVFRESSFIAGGVSLTVGTGNAAFASLANDEYVSVELPTGERDVFVRARSAEPTRIRLRLQPASRVCLRTSASSNTIAKTLFPVALMTTGYEFQLDEVACPSTAELARYKPVQVTYAPQ